MAKQLVERLGDSIETKLQAKPIVSQEIKELIDLLNIVGSTEQGMKKTVMAHVEQASQVLSDIALQNAETSLTELLAQDPKADVTTELCHRWKDTLQPIVHGKGISEANAKTVARFQNEFSKQLITLVATFGQHPEREQLATDLFEVLGQMERVGGDHEVAHSDMALIMTSARDLRKASLNLVQCDKDHRSRSQHIDILEQVRKAVHTWKATADPHTESTCEILKNLSLAWNSQLVRSINIYKSVAKTLHESKKQIVQEALKSLCEVKGGLRGGGHWHTVGWPEGVVPDLTNFDATLEHFERTLAKGPGKTIVQRKDALQEALDSVFVNRSSAFRVVSMCTLRTVRASCLFS